MKKTSTKYPINGTSALKPDLGNRSSQDASIISFRNVFYAGNDPLDQAEASDMPMNHMKRWQAVVVGIIFAATTYIGFFMPF